MLKLPYLPANYVVEDDGLLLVLIRVDEDGRRTTIAFFSSVGVTPEALKAAVAEDQAKLAKEK